MKLDSKSRALEAVPEEEAVVDLTAIELSSASAAGARGAGAATETTGNTADFSPAGFL